MLTVLRSTRPAIPATESGARSTVEVGGVPLPPRSTDGSVRPLPCRAATIPPPVSPPTRPAASSPAATSAAGRRLRRGARPRPSPGTPHGCSGTPHAGAASGRPYSCCPAYAAGCPAYGSAGWPHPGCATPCAL